MQSQTFVTALTVVLLNNLVTSPFMYDLVSSKVTSSVTDSRDRPTLVGVGLHSLVTLVLVALVGMMVSKVLRKVLK